MHRVRKGAFLGSQRDTPCQYERTGERQSNGRASKKRTGERQSNERASAKATNRQASAKARNGSFGNELPSDTHVPICDVHTRKLSQFSDSRAIWILRLAVRHVEYSNHYCHACATLRDFSSCSTCCDYPSCNALSVAVPRALFPLPSSNAVPYNTF